MQSFDRADFGVWNVVGYPVRCNGFGMGNFDLLPAKCSCDFSWQTKFERHLPHEPAFRLDGRRMDRSIVMVAATVDKDQTFPSRKDHVRSSGERQGRSPAGPILFCALRSPVRGRMRGGMRIFIHNDQISPDRLVRQALYLLFKAGVYSAESCG